jgi:hypothetical protein
MLYYQSYRARSKAGDDSESGIPTALESILYGSKLDVGRADIRKSYVKNINFYQI